MSYLKIYLATSWRNPEHSKVLTRLREVGLDVYNFKGSSFEWKDCDENYQLWHINEFVTHMNDDGPHKQFTRDMAALRSSNCLILIEPCGVSAHMELGFAVARGYYTGVCFPHPKFRPELMYKMVDVLTDNLEDLVRMLLDVESVWRPQASP